MSLVTLPEEVLEILFSYVDIEDLLTVWEVIRLEGSELFWRNVCIREGFDRLPRDGCWKAVFYRNINWISGKFVKREYTLDKYVRDLFDSEKFCGICLNDVLQGENLILKNGKNELSLWNIDKSPEFIKNIPAECVRASKSKLLVHYNIPRAKIYSSDNNSYNELLTLTCNLSRNVFSDYSLTDNYLAALDDSLDVVKIVDLSSLSDYNLPVSPKKVKSMCIVLSEDILNILVLDGPQYVLRRYNLSNQVWLNDILLFQGAAIIGVPNLEIGSNVIVSWSMLLERHGTTPLKVWNSNGDFLKTLSFEFIFSFGIQLQMPPEQILWLVVEGDYVIFSTYVTSITIWNSRNPDVCNEMPKSEHFYNGQSIISSSLLLLSYIYCFKVVDFKKAVYLYEISFESTSPTSSSLWQSLPYFVNENFYVCFKECENQIRENEPEISHDVSNELGTSLHVIKDLSVDQTKKTYSLIIYDFRAPIL